MSIVKSVTNEKHIPTIWNASTFIMFMRDVFVNILMYKLIFIQIRNYLNDIFYYLDRYYEKLKVNLQQETSYFTHDWYCLEYL